MRHQTPYLMEGPGEIERLERKSNAASTRQQLVATGLHRLPENAVAADAGCGSGFAARQMAGILGSTYASPSLYLLDASEERLEFARAALDEPRNVAVHAVRCDLAAIPLPASTVDYAFSRFVFEYLSDPAAAFAELLRITKPGGKIVVADLDYNGMTHYPLASDLEAQLHEIVEVLSVKRVFDPHVGRKLYSFFFERGLTDIRVRLEPHHLFYGDLGSGDLFNWRAKIDRIAMLDRAGELSLSFDLETFRERFFAFFESPGRFSYTPILIVEGTKPS